MDGNRRHSAAYGCRAGPFTVNDADTGIQVRTPLMALYDDKALSQLRDKPKAKRKTEEQTLDKWFGSTPPAKKAKADEPLKATLKTFKRMVVILCFAYDSPVLDPKAEHFPRERRTCMLHVGEARLRHTHRVPSCGSSISVSTQTQYR